MQSLQTSKHIEIHTHTHLWEEKKWLTWDVSLPCRLWGVRICKKDDAQSQNNRGWIGQECVKEPTHLYLYWETGSHVSDGKSFSLCVYTNWISFVRTITSMPADNKKIIGKHDFFLETGMKDKLHVPAQLVYSMSNITLCPPSDNNLSFINNWSISRTVARKQGNGSGIAVKTKMWLLLMRVKESNDGAWKSSA